MEVAGDQRVVYVFLENDVGKTVTLDDVKEWLQIIGDIDEVRLQYDTTSQAPCFHVKFKRETAAQQSVQYLSGARLKNCLVTIKSKVYRTASCDAASTQVGTDIASASETAAERESGAAAGPSKAQESQNLPYNHLLPFDLQMDYALTLQLSQLADCSRFNGADVLWAALKDTQCSLVEVYTILQEVERASQEADAELSALLSNQPAEPIVSPQYEARMGSAILSANLLFRNTVGVSDETQTAARTISLITDVFGPLSVCLQTTLNGIHFLVLRFMFRADEDDFRDVCVEMTRRPEPSAGPACAKSLLPYKWSVFACHNEMAVALPSFAGEDDIHKVVMERLSAS